jgi:hypothetical protein
MNKNLVKLFLIVYLFIFAGNHLYSQATSFCIEQAKLQFPELICDPTISQSYTANYMGCAVDVLINITYCKYQDPNCSADSIPVIFYNISSIDWNYDSCQNLTAYIFPGYPDNWGTINDYGFKQMMKSIDVQVATNIFVNYYNSLQDYEKTQFNCPGTPPNCDFPNCSAVNVIASNPKCEQLCLASRNVGTNGPRYYLGFAPCDDNNQSCCITEFKMCMCGNEVKQIETTWPTTFVCQGALPPSNGCIIPPDYTPIFNFPYCIAFCDEN